MPGVDVLGGVGTIINPSQKHSHQPARPYHGAGVCSHINGLSTALGLQFVTTLNASFSNERLRSMYLRRGCSEHSVLRVASFELGFSYRIFRRTYPTDLSIPSVYFSSIHPRLSTVRPLGRSTDNTCADPPGTANVLILGTNGAEVPMVIHHVSGTFIKKSRRVLYPEIGGLTCHLAGATMP